MKKFIWEYLKWSFFFWSFFLCLDPLFLEDASNLTSCFYRVIKNMQTNSLVWFYYLCWHRHIFHVGFFNGILRNSVCFNQGTFWLNGKYGKGSTRITLKINFNIWILHLVFRILSFLLVIQAKTSRACWLIWNEIFSLVLCFLICLLNFFAERNCSTKCLSERKSF